MNVGQHQVADNLLINLKTLTLDTMLIIYQLIDVNISKLKSVWYDHKLAVWIQRSGVGRRLCWLAAGTFVHLVVAALCLNSSWQSHRSLESIMRPTRIFISATERPDGREGERG